MSENEHDYTLDQAGDQAGDQSFYRDTFGERVAPEEEAEPMAAEADEMEDMVADESGAEMNAPEVAKDDDFRERLDDAEPMGDVATMDEPAADNEGLSEDDKSLGDKIRQRFNDLTAEDRHH